MTPSPPLWKPLPPVPGLRWKRRKITGNLTKQRKRRKNKQKVIGWGYAYELEILPCSEAFPLFSQTASKVRLKTNFCEATVILSRLPPNATAFRQRNETNCRLRVVYNFGENMGADEMHASYETRRSHDTRGVLSYLLSMISGSVILVFVMWTWTPLRPSHLGPCKWRTMNQKLKPVHNHSGE